MSSSRNPDDSPSFVDAYSYSPEDSGWGGFEGEDLSDLLAEVDRDLDTLAKRGDLDGAGRSATISNPEIPPAKRVDIFDPAHNMREVNKQLLLLEDHLFHPPKYCPDCVRKHLMKAEAFADESYSLDKQDEFGSTLSWLPHQLRELQDDFLVGLDKKSVAQRARYIRKRLSRETQSSLKKRAKKKRLGQDPVFVDDTIGPNARRRGRGTETRQGTSRPQPSEDFQRWEEEREAREVQKIEETGCPTPLPLPFFTNGEPSFWKHVGGGGPSEIEEIPQSGATLAPGMKVWIPLFSEDRSQTTGWVRGSVSEATEIDGYPVRCIPQNEATDVWGEEPDVASNRLFLWKGIRISRRAYVPVEWRTGDGQRWSIWMSAKNVIPVSPFNIVNKYFANRTLRFYKSDNTPNTPSYVDAVLNQNMLNSLSALEGAFWARLWMAGPWRPSAYSSRSTLGEVDTGWDDILMNGTEVEGLSDSTPPSSRPWLDGRKGLRGVNVNRVLNDLKERFPNEVFLPFNQERRLELFYRVVMSFLVQAIYVDSSGGRLTSFRTPCASNTLQSSGRPQDRRQGTNNNFENLSLPLWANRMAFDFLVAAGLHPDRDSVASQEDPTVRGDDEVISPSDSAGTKILAEARASEPLLKDLLMRALGVDAMILGEGSEGARRSQSFDSSAPGASDWASTWAYTMGDAISRTWTGEELEAGTSGGGAICTAESAELSQMIGTTTNAICQLSQCTPEGTIRPSAEVQRTRQRTYNPDIPTLVGYAFDAVEQGEFEERMSSNGRVNQMIDEAKGSEAQAMRAQKKGDEATFKFWTKSAAEKWGEISQESTELWPLVRSIGLYDTVQDIPKGYQARGDLVNRFRGTHWANIASAERAQMESRHSRFFLRSATEKGNTRKVVTAGLIGGALLAGGLYFKGNKAPTGEEP